MLQDKTQTLNRLQNSNCTTKTHTFGQNIKNPYLMQYKIFEQRVQNPKFKCRSLIMRKKITQMNKQNVKREMENYQQQLKEAKSILNKEKKVLQIFPFQSIQNDLQQTSRQSQVILKFKQKILAINNQKSDYNSVVNSQISFNSCNTFNHPFTQFPLQSNQKIILKTKPQTATNLYEYRRKQLSSRLFNTNNKDKKCPLTFINYKKNKSIVGRFHPEEK